MVILVLYRHQIRNSQIACEALPLIQSQRSKDVLNRLSEASKINGNLNVYLPEINYFPDTSVHFLSHDLLVVFFTSTDPRYQKNTIS